MNEGPKVLQVLRLSPGLFELHIERADVVFIPGDCMALYAGDGRASRPYSIASGVDEDRLRFLIREMPGGEVSSHLGALSEGDRVRVSPPFGWFRPGQAGDAAPSVFVATGTGVAPFLSYLRSVPDRPPRIFLHGVRHLRDATERDWLRGRCDLRLAVSREQASGCWHGRVTQFLDALPLDPGLHYYLCGLDAMIDTTATWLDARGVDITRIHRECFFNVE